MYRNQEYYADPTAGEALARIAREEQLLSLIHISEPTRH